jgi:predicted transcriptional regulator YdeE
MRISLKIFLVGKFHLKERRNLHREKVLSLKSFLCMESVWQWFEKERNHYERTYTEDLEKYIEKRKDTENYIVNLYIAIKE